MEDPMELFAITDKGIVRPDNQDSFASEKIGKRSIVVVCDGMGGARAGALASNISVRAFMEHVRACLTDETQFAPAEVVLAEAAGYANIRVYDRSRTDPDCRGMGSTLVAAVIDNGTAHVVNVGDSRAYVISGGKAKQVTHDHSFVQELVDRGEISPDEARSHPRKNIITQALGSSLSVKPDIFCSELALNDVLLLCSDGLSNTVAEEEIAEICSHDDSAESFCRSLIDLALERGAPDNITVAVYRA